MMKFVKMLGLAAIAAVAVTAFAGATTASATVLCETKTEACGSPYNGPVKAGLQTGTLAELATSVGTVKCSTSNSGGNVSSNGVGEITELTFKNCVIGSTSCTVEVQGLPYNASVVASSTLGDVNGTMTATAHSGGAKPGAHVTCGILINCTFSKSAVSLEALGGEPGKLLAHTELEREGGVCPSTSTWNATYVLSEPPTLFVLNS